jgi:hypothetical protein
VANPRYVDSQPIAQLDGRFIDRDVLVRRPQFQLATGRFALEALIAVGVEIHRKGSRARRTRSVQRTASPELISRSRLSDETHEFENLGDGNARSHDVKIDAWHCRFAL